METILNDSQPPEAATSEPPTSPNKKHKKSKREHRSKRHSTKQHHITTEPTPSDRVTGKKNVLSTEVENWAANHDCIELLSSVFPNNVCGDCNESGTQWASVNHGVFICIRCAGVHRSLGVHISKVKSTTMDRWTGAEVALMEAIGNRRGESLYSAHPPSSSSDGFLTKKSSNEEVKRFIERKYVRKEFAVANVEELLRKIHKQVGYQQIKTKKSSLAVDHGWNGANLDKAVTAKKVDPEQVVRALYGDATTSELTSKIRTIRQKKELKSQTIHGTFGVVNVSPEEYLDRLTMVLRAFEIDREVVPTIPDVEGDAQE